MSEQINVRTFLSFDRMIAPLVIKIVYWAGLIGLALAAIFSFFASFAVMQYSVASGLGQMVLSLIGFAFGVLIWRVVMEVYIVLFGIHDRLGEIKDLLGKGQD